MPRSSSAWRGSERASRRALHLLAVVEKNIKANQTAIALGEQLLGDRFLVIDFDDICHTPNKAIKTLISFLDLDSNNVNIGKLCNLIKIPKSIGRYKTHNLGIFSKEEINAVMNLGFEVDIKQIKLQK